MLKFHEILDGYLFQRGATHNRPAEDVSQLVDELGIRYVVSLAPAEPDPRYAQMGIAHWHLPIPDGKRFTPENVTAVEAVAKYLGEAVHTAPVLSMCYAGRNRSGLMSALILIHGGFAASGEEAIATVQARRPEALANPTFTDYLTRTYPS